MPSFAETGHLITVGAIQAGLGLAVGALLLNLHRANRECYLLYWAGAWLVMSALSVTGVAALWIGHVESGPGLVVGLSAVLIGYLQPVALGLAAMSLATPRLRRATAWAFAAGSLAAALALVALAGLLQRATEVRALIAVVPSHLFCVVTNVWFAWSFARHSRRARTTAGRLVIGFSLLYAVHLLVLATAWAGRDVYRNPTLPAVVGLLLPMGITAGIVLSVLQDAAESSARLRQADAVNRALLEAIPDMLVVLDRDGVYRDFRAAKGFAPLLPPEQFLGRRAEDFLPAGLAALQRAHLQQALSTGETQVFEYSLQAAGDEAHFEARLAPGDGDRVIGIVRDVTARRQAEQEREALIAELSRKNAELADNNAELERFTYTVSHDLRSPLVTILGFLGFADKALAAGEGEKARADLERVRAAATKMEQLLRELLDLSRVGRAAAPARPCDLDAIAREVVTLLEAPIAQQRAEVQLRPDLPTVYADPVRLREILQNLLENAVRFAGGAARPQVTVGSRGRDGDGRHVIWVADNGVGVEPRHHERIFGLFEKLDPHGEGTGVGLALVRRIVESYGGRTWVESDGLGHGATFFFTLPAAPEPAAPGD